MFGKNRWKNMVCSRPMHESEPRVKHGGQHPLPCTFDNVPHECLICENFENIFWRGTLLHSSSVRISAIQIRPRPCMWSATMADTENSKH